MIQKKRILIDQIPRLLRGYGQAHAGYGDDYQATVIVVCDLDDKCLKTFLGELQAVLDTCDPRPKTLFCIAIEEGEAWFLGDIPAIKIAYPKAEVAVIDTYVNDAICGTWEFLADAVSTGGAQFLKARGWRAVGTEKSAWAENIAPHMDVDQNASPSFCYFRERNGELTDPHQ